MRAVCFSSGWVSAGLPLQRVSHSIVFVFLPYQRVITVTSHIVLTKQVVSFNLSWLSLPARQIRKVLCGGRLIIAIITLMRIARTIFILLPNTDSGGRIACG